MSAPRNGDGTPHLCQITRMNLRMKWGTARLEKDEALYRDWHVADLLTEQACWIGLLESEGTSALLGLADDVCGYTVWEADARIDLLDDILAKRLFSMRRALYRPQEKDFVDWRDWVKAAREYPIELVLEDIGVQVNHHSFHCTTPELHGDGVDSNPSAWIRTKANRFTCQSCGNSGSILDVLQQTKVADSLKDAVKYMMSHYDLTPYLD